MILTAIMILLTIVITYQTYITSKYMDQQTDILSTEVDTAIEQLTLRIDKLERILMYNGLVEDIGDEDEEIVFEIEK